MKFKECPDCGASLDPCESCDCKKNEDTSDAAEMPSQDVNANDGNIVSTNSQNVNDCFRLREVRELTGCTGERPVEAGAEPVSEVHPADYEPM